MKGSGRGWPGGQVQAAGLAKTEPEIAGQHRRDPSFPSALFRRAELPLGLPCDTSELDLWGGEADDLYQTLDLLA